MTLLAGEVSNYPFTTKTPETGVASVVTLCVHKEFGVKDNPINSKCDDGWRFIPVEVTDLPGLIKGAWMGKGLGNQFLGHLRSTDALMLVVRCFPDPVAPTAAPPADPVGDAETVALELGLADDLLRRDLDEDRVPRGEV